MKKVALILFLTSISVSAYANTVSTPEAFSQTTQKPELDEAVRLSASVVTLFNQGKFDEAFPLAKRVLEIREKALGPDDELVVGAVLNLAEIQWARNRYSESRSLFEKVLHSYERSLGPEDIHLTKILDRLGVIYYALGQTAESEKSYKRSLALREKAFGSDHEEVSRALFNLAEFHKYQRDYKKAEPLYLRAIAINDKELPKDDVTATRVIERYVCFLYESKGLEEGKIKVNQFNEARRGDFRPPDPGQVLNGRAISLPAPSYPEEARAIRATGIVLVAITIDENGKVINARAQCGHAVFAKPSIEAAYRARFSPTKLSGMPVQVKGVIIYNFVAR